MIYTLFGVLNTIDNCNLISLYDYIFKMMNCRDLCYFKNARKILPTLNEAKNCLFSLVLFYLFSCSKICMISTAQFISRFNV